MRKLVSNNAEETKEEKSGEIREIVKIREGRSY